MFRCPEVSAPLVVHVVYRFDHGGLENGIVNLANHMPAERYRHAIVCLAGFNEGFCRRLARPEVPVVSIDKRPGKDPASYLRMWRVLRRLRPDIVHTRNFGTLDMQAVAIAARVRGRVHGEHGWSPADPQGLDPRKLRLRRAARRLVLRHVAMSLDIALWLERDVGVPPSQIRQIYNGVDLSRFSPEGPESPLLPKAADGTLTIGTVGRLDPIKNHLGLLDGFAAILERRPDFRDRLRLIIVGDGPLRSEVAARRDALGLASRVWLAGAQDDVPGIMRAMDVFVLPSRNEGISNTILEAMASGLPVVAGRVGGNPELVVEGVTGALYGDSDVEGLMGALMGYLDDPVRRRLHGEAGALRVRRHFSMGAMVESYLELYDEIMHVRHHRHR
jgi:sugar transferase (PEP-CTERM/EpsH1 system associated)